MSTAQPENSHRQFTVENEPAWRSENELYKSLIEIMADLDSSQTRQLLHRMESLAVTMRSMTGEGNCRRGRSELSSRETEVLVLISHGYTRRDVAKSLGISANTASRHISNIYAKLGISCVAEATAYAIQHNVTATPDWQ